MNKIRNTVLHLRAYAYGEPCEGLDVPGPHAFDLSDDDAEILLKGLQVMQLMAVLTPPSDVDSERPDVMTMYRNFVSLHNFAKEIDDHE